MSLNKSLSCQNIIISRLVFLNCESQFQLHQGWVDVFLHLNLLGSMQYFRSPMLKYVVISAYIRDLILHA